jgi:hypothetical protein
MDVIDLTIRLASNAADVVAKGHGIPLGGAVFEALMRDLLQVQDEQTQTLLRIERDVERLIDGPWQTARLYLHECLLPGRSVDQIRESQRQAAKYLHQALGQQRGFPAAYAAFDLAIVLAALGDAEGSRFYARRALFSAGLACGSEPVVGRLRQLRDVFTPPPKPQNRYLEWYLLAMEIEPLIGTPEVEKQVKFVDPAGVYFKIAVKNTPEFSSRPIPPWVVTTGWSWP